MLASMKKLRDRVVSPFENSPWFCGNPIAKDEVSVAISAGCLCPVPVNPCDNMSQNRSYHVQRIAHLVVHGWKDAISIDVGCPSLGYESSEFIIDGWHRFAAAIYRGDKYIEVDAAGECREISRLKFRGVPKKTA